MTYYSTGKSPYMRSVGKAVEVDDATAKILLAQGVIVESLKDLNVIEVQVPKEVIERETQAVEIPKVKRKGNPNWAKK